jgi:hypothetical protein
VDQHDRRPAARDPVDDAASVQLDLPLVKARWQRGNRVRPRNPLSPILVAGSGLARTGLTGGQRGTSPGTLAAVEALEPELGRKVFAQHQTEEWAEQLPPFPDPWIGCR